MQDVLRRAIHLIQQCANVTQTVVELGLQSFRAFSRARIYAEHSGGLQQRTNTRSHRNWIVMAHARQFVIPALPAEHACQLHLDLCFAREIIGKSLARRTIAEIGIIPDPALHHVRLPGKILHEHPDMIDIRIRPRPPGRFHEALHVFKGAINLRQRTINQFAGPGLFGCNDGRKHITAKSRTHGQRVFVRKTGNL